MEFMGFQIGQFVCYENEHGEIFYNCEVIAFDSTVNLVQLLYHPFPGSKFKRTIWVFPEDVFFENELIYI